MPKRIESETRKQFSTDAQLFKSLAHPVRLAILEELREEAHCVCHLEAHLGLRQAYISQQLSVLKAAGLIEDQREGLNIYYQVTHPQVFDLLNILHPQDENQDHHFVSSEIIRCPCPKCNQG